MPPLARKDEVIIQEIQGEVLVYDLESNKAVCLNETSALVWQNCNGHRDPQEIAKVVEEKLGSPVSEEFIWFAINQLNKENLLKPKVDYSEKFAGMSRRDVIKRVGLAAAVALPLVSTIVAPQAAHAQSTCFRPVGAACTCSAGAFTNGGSCPSVTCTGGSSCCNLTGCNPGGQQCAGFCR